MSKRYDSSAGLRVELSSFSLDPESFADETKYLRHKVGTLETELLHERQMSDLVNSKSIHYYIILLHFGQVIKYLYDCFYLFIYFFFSILIFMIFCILCIWKHLYILLEKETKRLEEELQKLQYTNETKEKELAQAKSECERFSRELRRLHGESGGDVNTSVEMVPPPSFSFDTPAGKFIDSAFRDVSDLLFEFVFNYGWFTCWFRVRSLH